MFNNVKLRSLYQAGAIVSYGKVQLSKDNSYPLIWVTDVNGRTTPIMFSKNFNEKHDVQAGMTIFEAFGGDISNASISTTEGGLRIGLGGSVGTSSADLAAAFGCEVVAGGSTADSPEALAAVVAALDAAFAESAARVAASQSER